MKNATLRKFISVTLALCFVLTAGLCTPANAEPRLAVQTIEPNTTVAPYVPEEEDNTPAPRYRWTRMNNTTAMADVMKKRLSAPVLITFDGGRYFLEFNDNGTSFKVTSTGVIPGFNANNDVFYSSCKAKNWPQLVVSSASSAEAGRYHIESPDKSKIVLLAAGALCWSEHEDHDFLFLSWTSDGDFGTDFYSETFFASSNYNTNELAKQYAATQDKFFNEGARWTDEHEDCFFRVVIPQVLAVSEMDFIRSGSSWRIGHTFALGDRNYYYMSRGLGYKDGNFSDSMSDAQVYIGEEIAYRPINSDTTWNTGIEVIDELCVVKEGVTLTVGKNATCVVSGDLYLNGSINVQGKLIIAKSGRVSADATSFGNRADQRITIGNGGSLMVMYGSYINLPSNLKLEENSSATIDGALFLLGMYENGGITTMGPQGIINVGSCYPADIETETILEDIATRNARSIASHASKIATRPTPVVTYSDIGIGTVSSADESEGAGEIRNQSGVVDNTAGALLMTCCCQSSQMTFTTEPTYKVFNMEDTIFN